MCRYNKHCTTGCNKCRPLNQSNKTVVIPVQGAKGDPLTWDDLTEEQKLSLKGDKGDKGDDFKFDGKGLFKDIPPANSVEVGYIYLAIDEGLYYISNGSAWEGGFVFSGTKFITVVADNQVFFYNDNPTKDVDKEYITLTATEYNFTGAPEDRKWQYLYNGLWIDIPNTFNTLTYNLHHQSAIWHGGDSVVIRYSVGEIYDQITIIKVYKGVGELKVVVQSDYGDIFINGNIDTTLRAYAYWGGELINDELDDTAFQWFRTSGNPTEDEIWNYHKGRNKKAVEIDSSDVYRKAVFECEVTLNI